MIEESYVSFDTARMLKEAGFDVPCRDFFTIEDDGNVVITEARSCREHNSFEDCFISRPTLALAARWLREVNDTYINIERVTRTEGAIFYCYWSYYTVSVSTAWVGNISGGRYDSYEEALEAGLQEAIKLIKK